VPYKDPEKKKAAHKAWYERNRERKAAAHKVWYERNSERVAAKGKAWRELNSERIAAANKDWYQRNRERVSTTGKAYRERNRERIAAKGKAWAERNSERKAAKGKAWYERNRERRAATNKAWAERNPERAAEKGRRRRCRERNASIHLTANENQQLLILERTRQELQRETGRPYHIDHILPIIHGGIHHPINLRILEGEENLSKNAKLLPEAIALAPEHFRLYSERVSPERAWEFVRQLAEGLGLSEEDLDALITGKPLKSKPTLEDFFT
jgi:hypothetical protein